jgi:hypothetical protein
VVTSFLLPRRILSLAPAKVAAAGISIKIK